MLLDSRSGARAGATTRRASAGPRSTLAHVAVGALLALLAACQDPAAPTIVTRLDALDAGPRASVSAARDEGDVIPDEYIVTFRDDEKDAPGLAKRLVGEHGGTLRFTYTAALKGFAAHMSAQAVEALRRNPRITRIEQDEALEATEIQSNPTWGLDRIDQKTLPLDRSYSYTSTGSGVTAYILDSGIRFGHVEFEGRAVRGTDVIGDGMNGGDCRGHGTHVAGTVGGKTWGVAKKAALVSVRVLDCNGSGTVSGAIAGLDWVTRNRRLPAVANMSFGAAVNQSLNTAVRGLLAAGVQVAIAAGNSDVDACTLSPGSTPEVVVVGAAGTADINSRQPFSNWGSCVDLFAPGSNIVSASHLDDTSGTIKSGTSMAAPHAAGVMALWLQQEPTLTPAQLHELLVSSAAQNVVVNANGPNAHMLYASRGTATVPAPSPVPLASFDASCAALGCTFDASGSTAGGTSLARFDWTFGDGATATGMTTSRSYASAGSYSVTLTVTDTRGVTARSTRTVTPVAINRPPVAAFLVSCQQLTCTFTDQSADADGAVASRSWSFGDGGTSTSQSPAHSYAASGTYSVRLDLTDDLGLRASSTQTVTVAPLGISLRATSLKAKGQSAVSLAWSGAAGAQVTIRRNGVALRTVSNTGSYTDSPVVRGDWRYRVCETSGGTCSGEVTVQVR